MKINFFEKLIGSGLYTGYFPIASGTVGSFAALLIFLIPGFEELYVIVPAIILFFFYGVTVGNKFEIVYGKDPAQCTVDEFVGTWITLLFVPKEFLIIAIAFFIWRILDILKPFPANKAENIRGGLGIMLDDVISGIYSLILIQIILFFMK